ncbi:MAG: hypothetical protein KBG15_00345 [Kofleriaceae bacterium]|nr:hypothetical protein [Kofleriaceae bacterium]
MIRWLRLATTWVAVAAMLCIGVIAGLFLVANSGWVAIAIPPWLQDVFGQRPREVWLPALIAGWLLAAILAGGLLAGSLYYVWRRRQSEATVTKLERELARLRNLPFDAPAPLEDLPEKPNAVAAQAMARWPGEGGVGP